MFDESMEEQIDEWKTERKGSNETKDEIAFEVSQFESILEQVFSFFPHHYCMFRSHQKVKFRH